jgi:hypothetical protein
MMKCHPRSQRRASTRMGRWFTSRTNRRARWWVTQVTRLRVNSGCGPSKNRSSHSPQQKRRRSHTKVVGRKVGHPDPAAVMHRSSAEPAVRAANHPVQILHEHL